jgi:hypothetical protein
LSKLKKLGRVLASINLMKKLSELYCQAMTEYFGLNGKPLANLVMRNAAQSISSYTQANTDSTGLASGIYFVKLFYLSYL